MLIRKIVTQEKCNEVIKAQQADDHFMPTPTHVVEDSEGGILGSLSFIPTVIVWMDTKKNNAPSCKRMEEQVLSSFAMAGHEWIMIPCKKDSPLHDWLERIGYSKVEGFNLFLKKI